jgi:lipopolysaccharide biosynthesis glycosyltransferase
MKSQVTHIAVASDSNYLPGLLVTLGTAAASCSPGKRLRVTVLDSGIRDPDWKFLQQRLSSFEDRLTLERVPVGPERFSHLPPGIGGNHGTYCRLLIPELIDSDRVIYLDVDLLVLKDLSPLGRLDLENHPVAAVADAWIPSLAWELDAPVSEELCRHRYFNSGLLVIDTGYWRRNDIAGQAIALINEYGNRFRYCDQPALNMLFAGSTLYLDGDWNLQHLVTFSSLRNGNVMGRNLHFTDSSPWQEYDPGLPAAAWYFCYEMLSGEKNAIQALDLVESKKRVERRLGRHLRKRLLNQLGGRFSRFRFHDSKIISSRYDPEVLFCLKRQLEHLVLKRRERTWSP